MTQFPVRYPWLARLALLAASIGCALVGLELLVRLAGADRPLLWQPHPRLGWWHIPRATQHWTEEGDGWVEINSAGMRDVERATSKVPGVFRIAVFGDSVTEAVQVDFDETFCQIIEERLQARGIRAEVLNFGVNGYSPLQAYLLYKQEGRAFDPDLVLHVAFLDNDVADLDPALASGDRGAPFLVDNASPELSVDYSRAESSYRDYTRQPVFALRRLSATYRVVSAARSAWLQSSFIRAGAAANEGIPKRYLLYEESLSANWQRAWDRFERVVLQFARDVRSDGGRYVIVSAPAGQVVNETAWAQLLDSYPAMNKRRWRLSAPEIALSDFAARRGLDLVAPVDVFRASSSQVPLFFGDVGHLTPRGHEVMAATIDVALTGLGLLPPTGQPTDETAVSQRRAQGES